MRARRAVTAVLLVATAGLAGACGSHNPRMGDANNDGTYINGGPIQYQLQVSRQLNPYSPEDSGYLRGLSGAEASLTPNQLWYGVFLWARNPGSKTYTTTDNFDIVDTQGTVFKPVKLDPAVNPYVWTAQPLAPGMVQPNPTTTAGTGGTAGNLLLFKLDNSIFENRPLTLQIRSPSNNKLWATISLDL